MKIVLLALFLLLACNDNPTAPQQTIGGAYVYEETNLKITATFHKSGTVYFKGEITGRDVTIDSHSWTHDGDMLCIDYDCDKVRNITAAGFDWYDAGTWNYWRKL